MNWLKKHKKTTWFSLTALVVILTGAVLIYFHERDSKATAQEDSSKQTGPIRVDVIQPKQGGVERLVKRPGDVRSFEYADLFTKVSGSLANQKVDIGSRVKEGQVLAEVHAPEYAADVKKASADVNKAEANAKASAARVDKAKAEVVVAQSQYEQSQADVTKAKALRVLRKEQYDRFKQLVAKNAVQKELLDEKEKDLEAAIASLFAAEKGVATAKANIASAKASVEQAKADLVDAEAQIGVAHAFLERAKVFVGYTQITSPYTGVVTKRNFHNGDFIQNASTGDKTPVLAVARTDKMRVVVQVPDTDVPFIRKGDTVTLAIDTLPDRKFSGTVARMAYSEVYETRTMRTEVDLENPVDEKHPDGILTNGMYGKMIVQLGREKGMRLPSTCVFGNEKGDRRTVYVVRDGKAREVKVKIGIDDGIEVTIREGLSASDQVVLERPSGLADGAQVEVLHDRTREDKADKEEKEKEKKMVEPDKKDQKKDKGKK